MNNSSTGDAHRVLLRLLLLLLVRHHSVPCFNAQGGREEKESLTVEAGNHHRKSEAEPWLSWWRACGERVRTPDTTPANVK